QEEVQRFRDQVLDQALDGLAGEDLVEHGAEATGGDGAHGVLRRGHAVLTPPAQPLNRSAHADSLLAGCPAGAGDRPRLDHGGASRGRPRPVAVALCSATRAPGLWTGHGSMTEQAE